MTFIGPNERDATMTGFSIAVPSGLSIEHAHEAEGWSVELDGSTATWTGGSLALNDEIRFGATLEADVEPGIVELQARQLYVDGGVVRWPVRVTITPAEESASQTFLVVGIVSAIGVLAVTAIAMLARRRRERALQEK